ncbi:c-type cytochrome [Alsobacter sp. KACC 23698]|uniref:C-type cytochrome n=1 Tax=Alsobacter sp. KACC 23698 TaxID=3149229 RepID=A0AAU7JK92_9HYPH
MTPWARWAALALVAWSPQGALAGPPPPAGAAVCSGCHGATPDASVGPVLQGRSADEIVAAMRDYREGRVPATVMDRIARGFSDEETRAVAAWIAEKP